MAVRLGPVTTGNRDVELGVAPHAVLRYVEPRRLHFGLRPDSHGHLHQPEYGERRREREGTDGHEAERLDPELMQTAAVEQPGRASRESLRLLGQREEAKGECSPHTCH